MNQKRNNSKAKVEAETNKNINIKDKDSLEKEIQAKKLLINNEKYLKDYLNFEVDLPQIEQQKTKPSNKHIQQRQNSKSQSNQNPTSNNNPNNNINKFKEPIKAIPKAKNPNNTNKLPISKTKQNPTHLVTNSKQPNQSVQTSQLTISTIKPLESETPKYIVYKLEKIFTETLTRIQNIKLNNQPELTDIEILKEEIGFLKQKNEILRLKADFYEIIFYSMRNMIDNLDEINEFISLKELKNKFLCIFTQNNNYYYDTLNFFKKDKSKDFLFAFDTNITDQTELINQKCLNTISNIDSNIHKILNQINSFINIPIESIKENGMFYSIKQNLIACSKEIMSYYLLSENFTFDFKNKSKFWLGNEEAYLNKETTERKTKFKKDFTTIVDPLLNKIINKKNKNDLINYVSNICTFYENYNQLLLSENYHLKSFNHDSLSKITKQKDYLLNLIKTYISANEVGLTKLRDVCDYVQNNQSKNPEKVFYSLFNTNKEDYLSIIDTYYTLREQIK